MPRRERKQSQGNREAWGYMCTSHRGLGSPLPGGVQIYRQRPEQRMEPRSYLEEEHSRTGVSACQGPKVGVY